jgi:hypothetical protein
LITCRLYALIALAALVTVFPTGASSGDTLASLCAIELSAPVLKSVHSSELYIEAAGDQLVISVTAKNCEQAAQSFVAVFEVRNSLTFTESLALQPVTLEGNGEAEIAVSWVPTYGDDYEMRAFAATNAAMPRALCPVMTSNVQIAERNTENLVLEFNVQRQTFRLPNRTAHHITLSTRAGIQCRLPLMAISAPTSHLTVRRQSGTGQTFHVHGDTRPR